MGHWARAPRLPFNFSGHFRAAQILTFDYVVAYPAKITHLVLCPLAPNLADATGQVTKIIAEMTVALFWTTVQKTDYH